MALRQAPLRQLEPSQPTPKEAARLHDEQKQKPAPRPSDKAAPERASPPDEAAKQDKVSKDQKQEALAWPIDTQALEQVLPPDQAAKQSDAAARLQAQPPSRLRSSPRSCRKPQLQLSLPDAPIVPGGLSPSFARPAGITRSGENDEFGRRVIRALRQTMPRPGGVLGQVTVRFLLSENGNLVEVRLMQERGDPIIGPERGVRREAIELPDPACRLDADRPHFPGDLHLPLRQGERPREASTTTTVALSLDRVAGERARLRGCCVRYGVPFPSPLGAERPRGA